MAEGEFINAEGPNTTAIPKITNIFGVSEDFLGQLKTWLEQNPPTIPISQIVGFNQFTVQSAPKISTGSVESTTSTTYTNLTTAGPTLSGLPDGQYLVLFGCSAAGASNACFMNVSINGATPGSDDDAAQFSTTTLGISGSSAFTTTLKTGGNNSLKGVYRSNAGASSAGFNHRWLIAVRYAN